MRALLLGLAFCLAPGPAWADSNLSRSLDKARNDFALSRAAAQSAESEAAPLAEKVRELKAVDSPWWWTRWRLRRNLFKLQESLDRLREVRTIYENSRQELFLVLSALEEEQRSALNRELGRSNVQKKRVQELFSAKAVFDRELEAMGFGESKPFPLVNDPGQVAVPLLRADRQKALQARAIQLEAWSDTIKEDLRLVKRARDTGGLDAAPARERLAELEALSKRILSMIRENEKQLLSKN